MLSQLPILLEEIESGSLATPDELESFRLRFLSRNGLVQEMFGLLKTAPPEERKALGQQLNGLKQAAENRYNAAKEAIEQGQAAQAQDAFDPTLPPVPGQTGSRHPIPLVRDQMMAIFRRIGFSVATGPEIEDDWHNFTALNFAKDHPAREMQDTFFIRRSEEEGDLLLRTHTSPVQIRVMESRKPPIRVLAPGRVYRNEAISARAHCLFHQVEGLYVDKNVSFADLKQTLYYFVRELFGQDVQIRFRPSYFPFTEPSAEVDVSCFICHGAGCNVCKYTGWVEIGGSGMVHPNVLKSCGIDPDEYSGFAFGMGVERTAMLLHNVKDLRLFTENDLRFLGQFASL